MKSLLSNKLNSQQQQHTSQQKGDEKKSDDQENHSTGRAVANGKLFLCYLSSPPYLDAILRTK